MKENKVYKAIIYIHISFINAVLFSFTSILSVGFLLVPSLSALMEISNSISFDEYDVFGNHILTFIHLVRKYINKKTIIIHAFSLLNIFSLLIISNEQNIVLSIMMFSFLGLTFTYQFYLAFYMIKNSKFELSEPLVLMLADLKSLFVIFLIVIIFLISHLSIKLALFNYLLSFVSIYFMTLILLSVFEKLQTRMEDTNRCIYH